MFAPSPQLQALADGLRPALGLPGFGEVTEDLARFAIDRHRVGPLLFHALAQADRRTSDTANALLEETAARNVRRTLKQEAAEFRLAGIFGDAGIAHAFIKGRALGTMLYGRPGVRQSRDVDVLVDPERLDDAITLLVHAGYRMGTRDPIDAARLRARFRFHREAALHDPHSRMTVEIHRRLLAYPPGGWDDTAFLRDRLDTGNAFYLLYLILHGAASYWHRLKWLADLAMILQQAPAPVRVEIAGLARHFGCLSSLHASLRACATLWPDLTADTWLGRTGLPVNESEVKRRLAAYAVSIDDMGDIAPRPSFWRRAVGEDSVPLFERRTASRMQKLRNRIGFFYVERLWGAGYRKP